MSIDHAIAAEKLVTIAGKEYKLAALTLAEYGLLVRHLKEQAVDPRPVARKLAATLPEKEAAEVLRDAVQDYRANVMSINTDHAVDYIFASGDGMAWGLWLAMQQNHAGALSRDEIYKWLAKLSRRPESKREIERIAIALGELSGVHELGNLPAGASDAPAGNQTAPSIGT